MEEVDASKIAQAIRDELMLSEQGNKTSIPYIKNSLPNAKSTPKDGQYQLLVIGGSIFKKVSTKFSQQLSLPDKSTERLPLFDTADTFLQFILSEYDPTCTRVALNFAYPISPVLREGRLDGILLSGTKEHAFTGLQGKCVGEEIERAIYEKYGNKIEVTVANDTVCLLLAGSTLQTHDEIIATIIGTGVNVAFFSNARDIINTEIANFDKFSLSEIAKYIDNQSANPHHALFEKELAGGYLYKHFNYLISKNAISYPLISSTHELDINAQTDSQVGKIALSLLNRSATLTGALLAGVAMFKGRSLHCIMEGSLFWHGYQYADIVHQTATNLCPQYTFSFEKIKDSSLLGAAQLLT